MKTKIFPIIISLFFSAIAFGSSKSAYQWNKLSNGILYAKYSFSNGRLDYTTIHAFKLDPAKVRMGIVAKNDAKGSSVKKMANESDAVIVINGGFFSEEHEPIGLLVNQGNRLNPLHNTSWWSIFGIKNKKPFIVKPKEFKFSSKLEMAIQVGPRVVIDGAVPKLKNGLAARSAIGITKDNKVILVVTEGSPISLGELGVRMSKNGFHGGLECINAMALDGGGSSQLYAKIDDFELSLTGLANVPNGVAIFQIKPDKR